MWIQSLLWYKHATLTLQDAVSKCWWPYHRQKYAERWQVWVSPAGKQLHSLLIQRKVPEAKAKRFISLTHPDTKNSKTPALWNTLKGPLTHHWGPAHTLHNNLLSSDDEHFFSSSVLSHFPFSSVNSWQEVKVGAEESQALRTQVQLAEAAQKQARGMEMDYEEVIHLLEAEIAELKTQSVEQPVLTNKVTNRTQRRYVVQPKLTLFRLCLFFKLTHFISLQEWKTKPQKKLVGLRCMMVVWTFSSTLIQRSYVPMEAIKLLSEGGDTGYSSKRTWHLLKNESCCQPLQDNYCTGARKNLFHFLPIWMKRWCCITNTTMQMYMLSKDLDLGSTLSAAVSIKLHITPLRK